MYFGHKMMKKMMTKNLRFCSSLYRKFQTHKLGAKSNIVAGFGSSFYFLQKKKINRSKKSYNKPTDTSINPSFYFQSETWIYFFKFFSIKTLYWHSFRSFFQVSSFIIPHIIWGYKYPIIVNGVRGNGIKKQKGTSRDFFSRVTHNRRTFLQSDFVFGFLSKKEYGCSL